MSIEIPALYEHQEKVVHATRASLAKHKAAILCAQPGFGKTRCSKWMLGAAMSKPPKTNQSGHYLFCVHRRGLVFNASNSFKENPSLPHGVIMSGVEPEWHHRIQVASIDTLLSWFCEGGKYSTTQTYDFVCFDETHSHLGKLRTFLNAHSIKREELGLHEPYTLGLSATPQAKGLADIYGEIIKGPSPEWLIENGYLSPFRYFKGKQGDIGKLIKRGDEFTTASVEQAMSGLAGDMVRDWKKHAAGRATIGFFPLRSHAQEATEILRAAGLTVEYLDGETPDDKRSAIFKAMNDGHLDYICNVGVVERGTDIPRVGCIQMCTAVGSLPRWRQMIGRGSRVHPDVPDCIVLDHGGNIARHGFFEDDIDWTLDWTERASKTHKPRSTITCPRCEAQYRGGECPHCGYAPTKNERAEQGLVFTKSELKEVSPGGKAKDRKNMSNEEIMISCLYMAGKSGRTFKQAIGMAYAKARQQGTQFQVPKRFEVAGKTFTAIPYNSTLQKSRVSATYPFTIGDFGRQSNQFMLD